jgi:RND family efflux transporter MFP subunit
MAMDDRLSSDLASLRIDRNQRPPSSHSLRGVGWLIGLLVLAGAGIAAWRVAAPMVEATLFKTEVGLTEIALVSPAQAQIELTSTGYVVPQIEVDVSSKLVGRVDKANVREGSTVKRGQILFELDASDQRTQVASAQARVAAARAREATSRAQLAETTLQLQRERKLAASGAVGSATADDLGARANSLEEQVRATQADVEASQSEVTALSVTLANTTIHAPIDGTVMAKPLQPGDVVNPGTPMAKIADFDSIVVETDVPEARLHLVKTGGPCEIVLDAYPDKRWRGEVAETSPQLNRAKATATVKVRFLDRDATVLPEMAARVSFLDAPLDEQKLSEHPKKVVPANAVADRGGAKVVFTLDSGRVHMIPVALGPPFSGGFELIDGPAPGTKVVSDPAPALEDGQAIKERSP